MIEVREKTRDGAKVRQLKCPGCGQWGDIDEDQYHGSVSIECPNEKCSFHATVNVAEKVKEAGGDADHGV